MNALKRGFSLIELLVVAAIISILVGIMLAAIQRVQDAADLAICQSNMKQIGTALHCFHDAMGFFPTNQSQLSRVSSTMRLARRGVDRPFSIQLSSTPEEWAMCRLFPMQVSNFYIDILPYVEQTSLLGNLASMTEDEITTVDLFVCPARHTPKDVQNEPICDYGHAIHPHLKSESSVFLNYSVTSAQWDGIFAIMGGVYVDGSQVPLNRIADGASNTLLLAHKGVEPRNYDSAIGKWSSLGGYHDHVRSLRPFLRDHVPTDIRRIFPGEQIDMFNIDDNRAHRNMTSPHRNMPCLYADGSVRGIGFDLPDYDIMARYWGYNDGSGSNDS